MNTPESSPTPAPRPPAPGLPPGMPTPEATRPRLALFALAILALIVIGFFVGLFPRMQARALLQTETKELAIPTVNVVSAVPGKSQVTLALPAEIKPFVEAPIHARSSGYLRRWHADLGAQIKAGELLAEIDTPEIDQELSQIRAQLAQAQAALELSKTTAARWAELLKTASVSDQEAAEKKADYTLKAATVDAARANVRRLEDLKSFARVTAPFDGVITARKTDVGELITAGSGKELFRLAQTATLRVFVHVPQNAARAITIGQVAELTVPEIPNRTFAAKVVRTSGAMSADSRTLLTELEVDNRDGALFAGGFAQARFPDARAEAALTLPASTLIFHAEGPQVGVTGADGRVELKNVVLGRDFGPTIEILSGITTSDRVIMNPADSLVSGMTVRVADASANPATK